MQHSKVLVFLAAIFAIVSAQYNDHNQEDDNNGDASYNYQYSVQDEKTGDYKSHQESRNGKEVQGVYTVREADGRTRIVRYTVGPHTGFNAVVEYVGEATIQDNGDQHNFAASNQKTHSLNHHEDASSYAGYQELSETSKFPVQNQGWTQEIVPKKPNYNEYKYQSADESAPVTQTSSVNNKPKKSRGKPQVTRGNQQSSQTQKSQTYSVTSGKQNWATSSGTSKVQVSLPKVNQYRTSIKPQPATVNQVSTSEDSQKYSNAQFTTFVPSGLTDPVKLPNNQGWSFTSPAEQPKVQVSLPTQSSQNVWNSNVDYPQQENTNQIALLAKLLHSNQIQQNQQRNRQVYSASTEKPELFQPAPVQLINNQQFGIPQNLLVNPGYQNQLVQPQYNVQQNEYGQGGNTQYV